MKVFYCSKCKKLEVNFNLSRDEEMIRRTWTNIRDGYGGGIYHLVCPKCGYVLSGYMRRKNLNDEYEIEYIKEVIKMYSSKNVKGYIKTDDIDFIARDQIENKIEMYKNNNRSYVKNIIDSMCMFD